MRRVSSLFCLALLISIASCDSDTITVGPQTPQGIQVTGTGSAFGSPDVAILGLGIEAEEREVGEARDAAADAMQQVIESLKSNGVAEKDIQTQRFNIYPVYDYTENRQVLRGYQVTNMLSVKVRDIDKTDDVIDDATAAGGKMIRVNSISFTIDDPTELREKAREEAMKDAIAKAKVLAELGGVDLGKPIYISEYVSTPAQSRYDSFVGAAEDAVPTPIESGELEITVTVSITYSIEE